MKTLSLSPRSRMLTTAIAVLAFGMASVSRADQAVKTVLKLPTSIKALISSSCDNSGGAEVTLDGSIKLGSFKENFIFKNNKKGTRTTNMISAHDVALIPLVGSISMPKQPSDGGVG